MAHSNTDLVYRGLDVFWAGQSQRPPVLSEEWSQSFQLIVIAKEEIDIEDFMQDNGLAENPYLILKEPAGTEDQQAGTDRVACNAMAISAWREEENRRAEEERRLFKGLTRGDAEKRFK